jgi:hypothetical protein
VIAPFMFFEDLYARMLKAESINENTM